jgi:dihydrofolate synthase/folylpolyglutamate synthase
LPVSESALREGQFQAFVPGRLERLERQGVEIVLDVAHNPHGASFFMQQLQPVSGRQRAVFAMLADKDAGSTLDACLGKVDFMVSGRPERAARPALSSADAAVY